MQTHGFLGESDLSRLIAELDWAATPIGAIDDWPDVLKSMVALILRSQLPMTILWGSDGVMVYNDAYAEIAGNHHPAALGRKVLEAWPELVDFNEHVLKTCLAGGTLVYTDQEFTTCRQGKPEQVWMNLDFSPIVDLTGKPVGVISVVGETTTKLSAEKWLTAERERLRQMFEQAPGFVAILTGPEHVFELVNPAYLRLIGHRDILNQPVRRALPDLNPTFFHALDKVYKSGEPFSGVAVPVSFKRRGTNAVTRQYIDLVFQPVFGPSGKVLGIFAQGADVTARVKAELDVRQREEQFRTLAQAVPNHVWTASAAGQVDWVNDRFREYTRANIPDFDTAGWARLVHPEDIDDATARWNHVVASGTAHEIEMRIRRHDGIYRWFLVRATPLVDENSAVAKWIGTNTDIHERKLAEVERMRDLDRLWNLSRNLMMTFTLDGVISSVNPACIRLIGGTEADLIGHRLSEFLHPDDLTRTAAEIVKLTQGIFTKTFQCRVRRKNGSYRYLDWTAVPDAGRVHAVGRDITEQREIEDALRQSQKMEALGQLTGGIAHDFNNLLQAISGSLEIMRERIRQGRASETERFLDAAETSADRAAALTHRLLAFARRQPLSPRPVQPNPLISAMGDLLRRTLGEATRLNLQLDPEVWPALCDPNQLESAILNLALNARAAMADGGTLTIATSNVSVDDLAALHERELQPGQYVCVHVTDTGTGMTQAVLERAFEPFFTTKAMGNGTGLGLSMVYGFARQSRGHATIGSEFGKGTTVKLYLPRGDIEDRGENLLPEVRSMHPADGETVLVIEDEPVVRGQVVDVLTELGYRTIEAADGPSGLEILQSDQHVDLLITDIGLPGINGRRVADMGRALRRKLKVLFITGYAEDATNPSEFLKPGMQLITKPFLLSDLSARIRELLG